MSCTYNNGRMGCLNNHLIYRIKNILDTYIPEWHKKIKYNDDNIYDTLYNGIVKYAKSIDSNVDATDTFKLFRVLGSVNTDVMYELKKIENDIKKIEIVYDDNKGTSLEDMVHCIDKIYAYCPDDISCSVSMISMSKNPSHNILPNNMKSHLTKSQPEFVEEYFNEVKNKGINKTFVLLFHPNKSVEEFLYDGNNSIGHWLGMIIDHENKKIIYYNSYGTNIGKNGSINKSECEFVDWLKKINQFDDGYDYYYNTKKHQNPDRNTCGLHVLHFFEMMIKDDRTFNDVINWNGNILNWWKLRAE